MQCILNLKFVVSKLATSQFSRGFWGSAIQEYLAAMAVTLANAQINEDFEEMVDGEVLTLPS